MYTAGWDGGDAYTWDVLEDTRVLERNRRIGADLRAILAAISRRWSARDVLRNGPVPDGEAPAFADVVHRGHAELRNWLETGTSPTLRARLRAVT
jgi:hypothetical protein